MVHIRSPDKLVVMQDKHNRFSHILALVTYGDGTTIKYTQHSNKKLSSSAAKNVVYKTSISANFYKPESSIMK